LKFSLGKAKHTTLRQTFSRRLVLLLGIFSVVMSLLIVAAYQHQTDKLNRASMSDDLNHLLPRIQSQQRIWGDGADQLLEVIDWAGLLNLKEKERNAKLNSFLTAQAQSMGFEGIVIVDVTSGKILFDFWSNSEKPNLEMAVKDDQPYWYDDPNNILYTKIKKSPPTRGKNLYLFFFKAWDSAMLHRINLPDSTTFISLGSETLLSSAGNLAMESTQPSTGEYTEYKSKGIKYQEGSANLTDIFIADGKRLPLRLTERAPLENILPIQLVLIASIGVTLLFGILLFMFFGRWLRRLGARLDALANAAKRFNNVQTGEVTNGVRHLLQLAETDTEDQVNVVAQALSSLMTSAATRDEEQRAYLQTLELLQDAVIELSPDGRLLRATDAWKVMTGMDDLASCGIANCVHPEDSNELLKQLGELGDEQKGQFNVRFRIIHQNDTNKHFWVEGRFASIKSGSKTLSIRGVVRDITTTYRQEHQISHMALHDSLTDLPNRVLLEDRLTMAITRAARTGQRVTLGFIDLDHFKQVNDNFGHKTGDHMLKEVAQRLQTALRGSDTLSRWGGDEFVVLCPELTSLEDASDITQKLSLLVRENIAIDGMSFPFTFSAGFSVYPDDAENGEMLLAQADRAMFYAKAQGRNNIQFFNAIAGKETSQQSFHIQSRLIQAVRGNQIKCWLQPIMSAQTGQVIGVEALARWHDPEHGWVEPSVFIPMAESLGLIDKLGQIVWQQALQALALLPEHYRLSVNLSKRQLFSNIIVQQLCDDVSRINIEPGRIMLEITESIALSDVAYARERIAELDARGFGISIDDFGVGYSSLSQLHEIPADELKLDKSFVQRIHEKSGFIMATAIISIAQSLNLKCVAEGVEDERTAALLCSMGVEMLQGYYFAEAMAIEDFLTWLTAYADA
jgi:diguanylate cyclase (GGDEF)-like protein/PAS domain S-box-containing protein